MFFILEKNFFFFLTERVFFFQEKTTPTCEIEGTVGCAVERWDEDEVVGVGLLWDGGCCFFFNWSL